MAPAAVTTISILLFRMQFGLFSDQPRGDVVRKRGQIGEQVTSLRWLLAEKKAQIRRSALNRIDAAL
ncbi:hypothetical protein [Bradyrhizobium sp. USDA 3256]